jgi:demethylspheroidene O-methyltransferase
MAASQPLVAEEVLGRLPDFSAIAACSTSAAARARSCRVAAARAALRLMLFDLPAVAERRARASPPRDSARAPRSHGGDFRATRCRSGADLVTLVRVLHDHDDERVLACCARGRAAAGRPLLIAEPMAGTPRAPSRWATPISASTCWRWARPPARAGRAARRCCAAAGFVRAKRLRTATPLLTRVVVADVGRR